MMVSTSIWRDSAHMYMRHIYTIAFAQSGDAEFSEQASEDVWIYFCDNEYRNGLMDRIGDPSLLAEITSFTIEYCHNNSADKSSEVA